MNKFGGILFCLVKSPDSEKEKGTVILKVPTERKGSQSPRLTFCFLGNCSEPQFVPLLGQGNIGYFAQTNLLYQEYLNRSYQQSQHVSMSVATDLQNTLESLRKEYDQVISRANPDRMEEFLRRSLSAYHEDMIYARRHKVLSKEQIESFNHEYCAIADSIQDAKRELKKKD